jgi:hypothetical protein
MAATGNNATMPDRSNEPMFPYCNEMEKKDRASEMPAILKMVKAGERDSRCLFKAK